MLEYSAVCIAEDFNSGHIRPVINVYVFRGTSMEKEIMNMDRQEKGLKGTPVILIVAAAVGVLAAVSVNFFSFLERQLFEERSSNIVEFTDKASEIVDGVIEHSWQQVLSCEYVLKSDDIISEEQLVDVLVSTSDFIDADNTLVIAIDKNAGYYSSDRDTGSFPWTALLAAQTEDMQLVVSEVPHENSALYFMFMKRLKEPIVFADGSREITHLAVAVETEAVRDKISIFAFQDKCYTYLINEEGENLYQYTYENDFIEGNDILDAFRDYTIVSGGSYEEFVRKLEQGQNSAVEFEYIDGERKKQRWFAANAPVAFQNWQLLLFVPTEVLVANTMLLLDRTVSFFVVVSIVFLLLAVVIAVVMLMARSNKRLIQQKDEANLLLREAAEKANSASQAKSDFLSNMSHDIRTPINGIMGMTDIALKNIGNQDKVLDCLKKISSSSQHLLGLINDVLDMSRIESGKTKVNHESFDIRTCIDNCASIIGGQLATRDIELVREFSAFTHPLVVGDELHLRQVFINILGNSVKFTPDGGKIFFRVQEKESTDEKVLYHFELADTGIGMKAEFLPHIFEAFAQEDDGTRTTYKGTGLGMAITKQFIDLMGGTITVESTLNVGTKFVIEIWIDIDKNIGEDEVKAESRSNIKGMKILLVEDIELNLEIAQSILEEEGAVITPAMNGQEAVNTFMNNPPGTFDAVLMDIMMPVMDGITATKTIRAMARADAKTIPILAMTANAYEEDIRNTQAAGMNAHLSKPVDADVLCRTLTRFYHAEQAKAKVTELKGLKILLADDVELNLEIARTILEEEGVYVVTADNGQKAVEIFAGSPPGSFDVILMDVHMPVMDGIAATGAIRAMERADAGEIPILAMTADVYEEDVQKTKAAGMNGHLTKPLNLEKLMWLLSGYNEVS